MATNTTNLKLKKPAQEDFYNINDFNENFDKIDDFAGGAWTISENGMVTNITDMNDLVTSGYYKGSSVLKNTPDTPKNGDIIIVFTWDKNSVLQIYSTTQAGYPLWYRKSNFGGDDGSGKPTRVWTNWKRFANASDFLPSSGGTLSGDLLFKSAGDIPSFLFADSGKTFLGSQTGVDRTQLCVNTATSDLIYGMLFDRKGKSYALFGEHNKPTGTYTGNQDEYNTPPYNTTRTISVGGIGILLVVQSNQGTAFVTPQGALCIIGSDIGWLSKDGDNGISYENGMLVTNNGNKTGWLLFNRTGVTYTYYCI